MKHTVRVKDGIFYIGNAFFEDQEMIRGYIPKFRGSIIDTIDGTDVVNLPEIAKVKQILINGRWRDCKLPYLWREGDKDCRTVVRFSEEQLRQQYAGLSSSAVLHSILDDAEEGKQKEFKRDGCDCPHPCDGYPDSCGVSIVEKVEATEPTSDTWFICDKCGGTGLNPEMGTIIPADHPTCLECSGNGYVKRSYQ